MERETALRQIKTMLDIATRDTTPVGEAQAAMAKAHLLMQKYAIDEREAHHTEATKGKMSDAFATTDIGKRAWSMIMAVPISQMTMTFAVRDVNTNKIHFYGREHDLELALFTFDGTANMIEAQAAVAFKNHAAEYKAQTGESLWSQAGVQGKRAAYMKEFMKGAALGFVAAIRAAEEHAKTNNTMALVAMTTRRDEVEQYVRSTISLRRNGTKVKENNGGKGTGAFEAGKAYGASISAPKGIKS